MSKQRTYTGNLIDYGSAPYQHNPENTISYYVELEQDNRKFKIWGVDLEEAIKKSSVEIGDNVVLNYLGNTIVNIPDPKDPEMYKTVKRNSWEIEPYEAYQNLNNAIEQDIEREQEKTQPKEVDQSNYEQQKTQFEVKQPKEVEEHIQKEEVKKKLVLSDELPSSVKNNYVAILKNRLLKDEKINYYEKTDTKQVNIAFEDRKTSLHTSRQDEKTINAMLDLAESKNWSSIKLKGTEEFKQKAWLEASLRGIETKGYKPTERDLAELQAKQENRTVNNIEGLETKTPIIDKQQEIQHTTPEPTQTVQQSHKNVEISPEPNNQAEMNYLKDIHERNISKMLDFSTQNINILTKEDILSDYAKTVATLHQSVERNHVLHEEYNRIADKVIENHANKLSDVERSNLSTNIDIFKQNFETQLTQSQEINHKDIEDLSLQHNLIQPQLSKQEYEHIPVSEATQYIYDLGNFDKEIYQKLEQAIQNISVQENIMQDYAKSVAQLHNTVEVENISKQNYVDILEQTIETNKDKLLEQEYKQLSSVVENFSTQTQVDKQGFNVNNETENKRYTFSELSAKEFEFNNYSEFFRQAVHIKDNVTEEHYIIGTYDTEYMNDKSIGVIAEYYKDNQEFTERNPSLLVENEEQVFNKLGLHSEQSISDIINHINGLNEISAERADNILSRDNLMKQIGQVEPILDNSQSLALQTAKDVDLDVKQQAVITSVLLELGSNRDYRNSNYLDKSNMIMTEVSGLIGKTINEEQYIDFSEKLESKTKEIVSEQNIGLSNFQQKEWQDKKAITDNIMIQIQESYKKGEFKSRDDVINKLTDMGYTVVRQREDGLSIEDPNDISKTIPLTGSLLRENFHEAIANIQELKEQLKPENLQQKYPNISQEKLTMISTALHQIDKPDYKRNPSGEPTPEKFEKILTEFSKNVNELAQGKISEIPLPKETPEITISLPSHGSPDRNR